METQTTTQKTEQELKAERVQEELAAAVADVVRLKAERVQGPVVAEIVITLHGTNPGQAG